MRQPEEKQKILSLLDHWAKCARDENSHFSNLAASLLMQGAYGKAGIRNPESGIRNPEPETETETEPEPELKLRPG